MDNPKDWFTLKLTVEETKHISLEEIEKEKNEGLMSEDMIAQEYYVSFDLGVEGSYYSKFIDKMRLNGQLTNVPYESSCRVFTAWDLGVHDATTIIFFQVIGAQIRIIDCYSNTDKGLDHYVKVVKEKPYVYDKHIAPHDIKVREFGATNAMSRLETAHNLGIDFTLAPNLSVEDGIEAVKASFTKTWIDETKCAPLLKALESYRRLYDAKKKRYADRPYHDWSSNFADAYRMLAISLPKLGTGMSAEELDRLYREAMYGETSNLPPMFR